ncbi:MAG: hypothetical protein J5J00_04160 [Deltaproteobacteria bacterium]|nr:hypothetical protein [Deltaproteobacteria bacterium]
MKTNHTIAGSRRQEAVRFTGPSFSECRANGRVLNVVLAVSALAGTMLAAFATTVSITTVSMFRPALSGKLNKSSSALDYLTRYLESTRRIIAILPLLLISCSASAPPPQSLQLKTSRGDFEWTVRLLQEDPYIYTLTIPQSDSPVFMTALKKCNIKKGVSTSALARELLVGMKAIEIERQEHLQRVEPAILFSTMRAELDRLPINLAAYSLRKEGCITDLVLWSERGRGHELWSYLADAEPEDLKQLHENLASEVE